MTPAQVIVAAERFTRTLKEQGVTPEIITGALLSMAVGELVMSGMDVNDVAYICHGTIDGTLKALVTLPSEDIQAMGRAVLADVATGHSDAHASPPSPLAGALTPEEIDALSKETP